MDSRFGLERIGRITDLSLESARAIARARRGVAVFDTKLEKKALEILADAVDRTVGTGFVHAAVLKASQTLAAHDYRQADKAFRMLNPRETRKVKSTAIESAELFQKFGDYDDAMTELAPDPRLRDIRSRSTKLGTG